MRQFVYTNVDRDGMLEGPDLDEVRRDRRGSCAGASSTPAASARSTTCEALAELRQVNLAGVIVGKALYEGRFTVAEGQARSRACPPRPRVRSVHFKRVIPCLDVDAGRVVKGTNFVDIRDAGDPVELAERYDAEGADELVFLDITATHEKRDTIVELARRTADNVFIPFTIGGGIRSVGGRAGGARRRRGQGLGQLGGGRPAGADRRAGRASSAPSASCWRSTPAGGAARARTAGRSSSRAGARRRAATPSRGRARASSAARGRSC